MGRKDKRSEVRGRGASIGDSRDHSDESVDLHGAKCASGVSGLGCNRKIHENCDLTGMSP